MSLTRWCIAMTLMAGLASSLSLPVMSQGPPFGPEVPEDPQSVRAMIDSIHKTDDIPSDPGVLYQEVTLARQQYEAYRAVRNTLHTETLDTQKAGFHTNIEGLRPLADECSKKKDPSEAQLVRQRIEQLSPYYFPGANFSGAQSNLNDQLQRLFNLTPNQLCQTLSDPTQIAAIEKAEDADIERNRKALTDKAVYAGQIADAWKDRYDTLSKQANKSSEATLLRVTLLFIVGGVCVFAWLIFRGVSTFDSSLQKELITSGQLIQFPTVMILLVVIVVLGLSSILDDKTLGALLGGIAGYVLSQGVGQSASRQALRAAVEGGAIGLGTSPPPIVPPPAPAAPSAVTGPGSGPVPTTPPVAGPSSGPAPATPPPVGGGLSGSDEADLTQPSPDRPPI
jgi:hypothetical protein